MSSICIQCIMRSHDRKLDNFLTLLILNIQVQKRKEKLSLSTVTEWSNALFKFKWKQIYIFLAAISLKRSSFKQIGLVNSTFWRQRRCWKHYVWRYGNRKWSVLDFLPFSFSRLCLKMKILSLAVCKIIVAILLATFVVGFWEIQWNRRCFNVCRWCKHQD